MKKDKGLLMLEKKLIDSFRDSEDLQETGIGKQAYVSSIARHRDVTSNRMSNNLLKAALYDSTPAAYNPFSAGVNSNIERAFNKCLQKK
jgi:hypothetical protein